jgi:hypothetical protein
VQRKPAKIVSPKSLSRQCSQTLAKLNSGRIDAFSESLIPPAKRRTHLRREQMLKSLANPGRILALCENEPLERIQQATHGQQISRQTGHNRRYLLDVMLKPWVGEFHDALCWLIFRQATHFAAHLG